MDLRLAVMSDLDQIKAIYQKIIAHMNANHINIWDEIYPCEFFAHDIENKQLYVLVNSEKQIVSAFALCPSNSGSESVGWEEQHSDALYIDRLGVSVDHLREGIGHMALQKAMELARQRKAGYLRLFVVDNNHAAIQLYQKAGFKKAAGSYDEVIDDGLVLHELGFEIKTTV